MKKGQVTIFTWLSGVMDLWQNGDFSHRENGFPTPSRRVQAFRQSSLRVKIVTCALPVTASWKTPF